MAQHTFTAYNNPTMAFAPAAYTSGTQNGSTIDTVTQGLPRRACLLVFHNPGAATTSNYQLQDSPDNSTWTNVSGATLSTPVAASTPTVTACEIDMAKRARYLRVQIIGTGTAGAAAATIVAFENEYLKPLAAPTPIFV